jgi:hypothetical protein
LSGGMKSCKLEDINGNAIDKAGIAKDEQGNPVKVVSNSAGLNAPAKQQVAPPDPDDSAVSPPRLGG